MPSGGFCLWLLFIARLPAYDLLYMVRMSQSAHCKEDGRHSPTHPWGEPLAEVVHFVFKASLPCIFLRHARAPYRRGTGTSFFLCEVSLEAAVGHCCRRCMAPKHSLPLKCRLLCWLCSVRSYISTTCRSSAVHHLCVVFLVGSVWGGPTLARRDARWPPIGYTATPVGCCHGLFRWRFGRSSLFFQ